MTSGRIANTAVLNLLWRVTIGFSMFTGLMGSSLADHPVWQELNTGTKASLRGLCVVDEQVVWASGSQGTVLLSTDAGKAWKDASVRQAGKLDFRDIHAFDAQHAIVLSAGQPARVYQTEDGGESWSLRFEHPDNRSFFDALSFWDKEHGIAMSDPVDGRVLLMESRDGGRSWHDLDLEHRPASHRGEAGFAASGTNMQVVSADRVYVALGGGEEGQLESFSRVVSSNNRGRSWVAAQVPIRRSRSAGVFSLAFVNTRLGVAVGGDYLKPDEKGNNIAITVDGGESWLRPTGNPPGGFRSCVTPITTQAGTAWLAVGPTGTDLSKDGGHNWMSVSKLGLHAVQFVPNSTVGFASGPEGRLAKWSGEFEL